MATRELRELSRELLETGRVNCVIGYEVGPRGITRPVFIRRPDETERLVWNEHCTHNLVAYLKEELNHQDGRVAVVVKPCDSKSINVLLAENRFELGRLHIIGVTCEGILDRKFLGADPPQLQGRCVECDLDQPVVFDQLVGELKTRKNHDGLDNGKVDLDWLEEAGSQARMEFWLRQFDRCIRCYACRQVCPVCDCPTCLFEREDSLWIGSRTGVQEKRMFHLGRAFHLAGRCVGCNECERVCPMDIPISMLNKTLAHELETAYQHFTGMEPVLSPLTTVLGEKE